MLKFTPANIEYYGDYLIWLSSVEPSKVKFMDECHFVSRHLNKAHGLSAIGDKVNIVNTGDLKTSITMTLLTDISTPEPIFAGLQTDTNDRFGFLGFILDAIEAGYLKNGDVLVCDNAAIHTADEIYGVVLHILEVAGVKWVRLPKYSPELNPCELIFAQLKNGLRNHRGKYSFKWELLLELARVTRHQVIACYAHCWKQVTM